MKAKKQSPDLILINLKEKDIKIDRRTEGKLKDNYVERTSDLSHLYDKMLPDLLANYPKEALHNDLFSTFAELARKKLLNFERFFVTGPLNSQRGVAFDYVQQVI